MLIDCWQYDYNEDQTQGPGMYLSIRRLEWWNNYCIWKFHGIHRRFDGRKFSLLATLQRNFQIQYSGVGAVGQGVHVPPLSKVITWGYCIFIIIVSYV